MKNRSEIWLSVLEDLGDMCSVSTHEDAEYLRSRVSAEGDSFFTITLPQFAKDLERSLAAEELSSTTFVGFARRRIAIRVKLDGSQLASQAKVKKMAWGVPLFLSGFTRRLFMEPDEIQRFMAQNEVSLGCGEPSLDYLPVISNQPPCLLLNPSSEEMSNEMADAIHAVRQLCLLFSKEKAPAPAKAERAALESYVKVDEELDRPL